MFATTHILAAVAIGQHAPDPWWAFVASLVSHYLLDVIPHGDGPLGPWMVADPGKKRMAYVLGADVLCSVLLLAFFWLDRDLPNATRVVPAIIGSVLPDLFWFIGYAWHKRKMTSGQTTFLLATLDHINDFHHKVHTLVDRHIKIIWTGIIAQAIVFFGLLYLVISWRH